MKKRMVLGFTVMWTLLGFTVGSLICLVLKCLCGLDVDYWVTAFMFSGYFGFFLGLVGGVIKVAECD